MMLRRPHTFAGAVLALALTVTGCTAGDPATPESAPRSTTASSVPPAASGPAVAALESLEVKGRAPRTGYDRGKFGPAWADTDHNGCDTRNDILARDLESETFRPGTHDCVVLTGVLADPYTATEIHFQRGQDTSTAVQIDHVVALSDAWQKGAQQLDTATRMEFANDPLNLLAVDGPANMQKGAGDAATWLPANRSFRCDYVARQIAVKARYDLWVTAAEKDAMARVLSDCPDHPLPDGQSTYRIDTTATVPVPEEPGTQPMALTGADPRFSSCAKAKDAGYGPYVAGIDPEYDWYRDGDNDGTVCE